MKFAEPESNSPEKKLGVPKVWSLEFGVVKTHRIVSDNSALYTPHSTLNWECLEFGVWSFEL